jgi:hypothetical protein
MELKIFILSDTQSHKDKYFIFYYLWKIGKTNKQENQKIKVIKLKETYWAGGMGRKEG